MVKETTAHLSDTHKIQMLFDPDAPPCPSGPCGVCGTNCPTRRGVADGVYESAYQVVEGLRNFVAVRSGVLLAAGEVPIGCDATCMIERLRREITRPRLSVSRGGRT